MTDELGNQMVYVEWDAKTEPKDRTVKLTWHVDRTEILAPEVTEDASKADPEAEKYLGGSEMVAVDDPAVTALAKQITEGKTTNYDKARAVYDWVYDNMVRDNSVKGCGQGDVCQLLSTKAGKCTDINSTFVGLCRAAGVPALPHVQVRTQKAQGAARVGSAALCRSGVLLCLYPPPL